MNALTISSWWIPILLAPFVGSFLANVAVRLPQGRNPAAGRSRCPGCGQRLAPLDLVPLLSWCWLRGCCRYCGMSISPVYPFVELAAVVVAVWAMSVVTGWAMWPTVILGWILLTLAAIDQRHLLLPDALTLPLILLGLAVGALLAQAVPEAQAIGAVAGFLAFAAVALAYRRLRGRDGLGFGDAKLLAAAGAWVGWQGLPAVVLIGAGTALVVVAVRRAAGAPQLADEPMAFGPYLCFGFWIVWLYGPPAIG